MKRELCNQGYTAEEARSKFAQTIALDDQLNQIQQNRQDQFAPTQPGDIMGREDIRAGSLSNIESRKWYLEREQTIPNLIDKNLPLAQQAKQAFELRNKFRTRARELMADRQLAEQLNRTEPNLTWDQMVNKQIEKGYSGDEIYKAIIESSQRSRKSINQILGLE